MLQTRRHLSRKNKYQNVNNGDLYFLLLLLLCVCVCVCVLIVSVFSSFAHQQFLIHTFIKK